MNDITYTLKIKRGRYWTNYRFVGSDQNTALLARLADEELISPAAYDMPIGDVINQVNETNGGEVVITVA